MKRLAEVGLRTRLALALVAMAVLAVGTATVLTNLGLPARVNEAAESRLDRQVTHLAAVAATFYEEDGRWTAEHVRAVDHLGQMSGLRVRLTSAGRTLGSGERLVGTTVTAPVLVGGRRIGQLAAQPSEGDLLTPEEQHLRHSLDRLHMAAAGVSVLAALALAFVLAQGLAGPLRKIRRGAERMAGGDLAARVEPGGGPELAAVAGALNRLAETLDHEEELRRATVADLAHELRTPVNGLLGRIEGAQDGVLEPESNLAAMHAEALRLTRLLDDLSALGDAERPGLLLDKAELELAELASEAVQRWQPRFTEGEVVLALEPERARVSGDAGRLAQVLDNLLSNALRHSEPGDRVVLRSAASDGVATLTVSDTGAGIPGDDLPHLFKRFWRGDRSRSRATGGTGIGLAIVSELVRAHEGTVEVDSEPGRGTTFRITLPALADRSRPSARTPVVAG